MAALTDKQTDALSAGLRHLRDAEHLASAGEHASLDQAWHLIGFALECLRKAGLSSLDDKVGKVLGHDFDDDAEQHLDWLIAIDPCAHRYQLSRWSERCSALLGWRAEARYERSGTTARDRSEALENLRIFGQARASDLLVRMYADGVLALEDI